MKIPRIFILDKSLEKKIKEYINKRETSGVASDKDNKQLYDEIVHTMVKELGYCKACTKEIIDYFVNQEKNKL